jgi:RimJ/RimL family protein N-acetyltransferase
MEIILQSGDVLLRPLTAEDAPDMALLANNKKIAQNLRDGFPHPYTLQDAENFVKMASGPDFGIVFAIEYQGKYVGNTGIVPGKDVYRQSAEIGYFIGEPYWNKGIATATVKLLTNYCFNEMGFARVWAGVFEFNPASQYVLEKCGFEKEAVHRMAVTKMGKLWNEVVFAKLNPNLDSDLIGKL